MNVLVIVSTEELDTMDLARVRRHRGSVVTDFSVTALQPTVFYLELLYLQVMLSLRKSCLGIFLASLGKTRWPPEPFLTFFLTFSLSSYSGCVIGIVFNFSGEINCYKRLP